MQELARLASSFCFIAGLAGRRGNLGLQKLTLQKDLFSKSSCCVGEASGC